MRRLEKHLSSKNNPVRKRSGSPQISYTMVLVKLSLNSLFFGELKKNFKICIPMPARYIPHFIFLSTRPICVPVSG